MTEIRVQDDTVTEHPNARSPLISKNLLLDDAYMQRQKTQS